MKKCALPLFLMLFACGDPAEQQTEVQADQSGEEGVVLFQQVTDSILAVQSVKYDFQVEGYAVMGDTIQLSSEGTAILSRNTVLEDSFIRLEYEAAESDTVRSGIIVADGEMAAHLDGLQSMYTFGMVEDDGASLVLRNYAPQAAVVREFLFPAEPFGAELNAYGYSLGEQEEVDGVLCDVVTVDMSPYISTWWISAETRLPMGNRIEVLGPDGSDMDFTVTLSNVDAEYIPAPEDFQIEVPEGAEEQQLFGSISAGMDAPLWTLETPEGDVVSLEDLRGRVVVMDFWATWCGPCRQVMPVLQELHEAHGEELVVLGINVWEQQDPASFMAENGFTYPIVVQGDQVAEDYIVEGIPAIYVIAPDGTVAYHAVGADPANEEALREVVGTLLSQQGN
ncbi:hypothetical protein CSA37_01050 [Candidatus Fermentibacteria bacterium]|nr:MAG: hypothetical protein CSA37_01050 [Candidatus Fermentibacteria bacterium]